MNNAALVLEGGSLRSLYTTGVLDVFLEYDIEFSAVIAVSAGALTAANYISGQKMRTAQINILHSCDSEYYGIRQLLLKKSAFNFDYLFNDPIDQLYPYNRQRLGETKQKFFIATTDCETGGIQYFDASGKYENMIEFLRASSSQPLLAPMVKVKGKNYLDGGIIAPIGIDKAFEEGYEKIVVVLTRERDYIKQPKSILIRALFEIYYRKYPKLLDALHKMPCVYNGLKKKINQLEEEGKIFVIQPKSMIKISSVEKNARKLAKLYFQGIYDAEKNIDLMQKYIGF